MIENNPVQPTNNAELEALLEQAATDSAQLEPLITHFLLLLVAYDPRTLQHYSEEVLVIVLRWKEKHTEANAYYYFIKGSIQFYLSNFSEAEKELLHALEATNTVTQKETEGLIRTLLGANYRSMGDMDLAIENQLLAYHLTPRHGVYLTFRILCLYQLGETHVTIRDFLPSLRYYQEAVSEMQPGFNTGIRFRIYSGLAICQMHLGNYEESQRNITMVFEIPGLSIRMQSRALFDLGIIYSNQGKHTEAIKAMKESYVLRKNNDLIDASSTSLLYLAKEYISTGQSEEALLSLNEALAITELFNAKGKRITALELLARVHQQLNQHEKATQYYEEFVKLRETEHAEQERRIFRFKNNLIEQQRKELDIKNRQLNSTLDELSEAKRSKRAMVYSIVTLIVLVLLTEIFVDPFIDSYAYNNYISLALKALIALLLKPIDSFYESMLFDRALKKREA